MFHQLLLASDAACSSLGMLLAGCVMQDPFAEKTVYNDGPIDKLFIKLFTQKMADQLEGESTLLTEQQALQLAMMGHQSMANAAVARLAAWQCHIQPSVGYCQLQHGPACSSKGNL
jgi:hypothetical protein